MNPLSFLGLGWVKLALIGAVLAAVTAAYFGWRGQQREIGRAEVRAEWAAEREAQKDAALAATTEYRRMEQRRMSLAAQAQQRKDHAIHALDTRLAAALDELRSRPDRPAAGDPAASQPAPGAACTGAGLYRPDAAFLVREAARAQRILAERDYCHDRYDALTNR